MAPITKDNLLKAGFKDVIWGYVKKTPYYQMLYWVESISSDIFIENAEIRFEVYLQTNTGVTDLIDFISSGDIDKDEQKAKQLYILWHA